MTVADKSTVLARTTRYSFSQRWTAGNGGRERLIVVAPSCLFNVPDVANRPSSKT